MIAAGRSNNGQSPIPARAGIGLKPAHYRKLLSDKPPVGFLEVHAENYMSEGGPPHRYLSALAEHYRLSIHGVGMSLGSVGSLDREHLRRWRTLIERYDPALVSEHVAWSSYNGVALHDLLPLPYTEEALDILCGHISEMQDYLDRKILVENPSTYLAWRHSAIPEPEFILEATRRTGCGLLLDINNVYVSARNHDFAARSWLKQIPASIVGEVHLAGHAVVSSARREIRIDDHGSRVHEDVWALYRETIGRIGGRPTLIEWDTSIPGLGVLLSEAERADKECETAVSEDVLA